MYDAYEEWKDNVGCFAAVIAIIALIALILFLDFLIISFVYYVFTLIMFTFFSVVIPFTWHYAIGIWLISILIGMVFKGTTYAIKIR